MRELLDRVDEAMILLGGVERELRALEPRDLNAVQKRRRLEGRRRRDGRRLDGRCVRLPLLRRSALVAPFAVFLRRRLSASAAGRGRRFAEPGLAEAGLAELAESGLVVIKLPGAPSWMR